MRQLRRGFVFALVVGVLGSATVVQEAQGFPMMGESSTWGFFFSDYTPASGLEGFVHLTNEYSFTADTLVRIQLVPGEMPGSAGEARGTIPQEFLPAATCPAVPDCGFFDMAELVANPRIKSYTIDNSHLRYAWVKGTSATGATLGALLRMDPATAEWCEVGCRVTEGWGAFTDSLTATRGERRWTSVTGTGLEISSPPNTLWSFDQGGGGLLRTVERSDGRAYPASDLGYTLGGIYEIYVHGITAGPADDLFMLYQRPAILFNPDGGPVWIARLDSNNTPVNIQALVRADGQWVGAPTAFLFRPHSAGYGGELLIAADPSIKHDSGGLDFWWEHKTQLVYRVPLTYGPSSVSCECDQRELLGWCLADDEGQPRCTEVNDDPRFLWDDVTGESGERIVLARPPAGAYEIGVENTAGAAWEAELTVRWKGEELRSAVFTIAPGLAPVATLQVESGEKDWWSDVSLELEE